MIRKFLEIEAGLSLRLLEPAHAPELFGLVERSRERLGRWQAWFTAIERIGDVTGFIDKSRVELLSGKTAAYGVFAQGHLVGGASFYGIDAINGRADLGYWLGEGFEGKGLVTRACRALIGQAFGEMELNRVQICCAPENARSCAVAARLGFTLEGTLREAELIHGRFVDNRVYGLLKGDPRPG